MKILKTLSASKLYWCSVFVDYRRRSMSPSFNIITHLS